MNSYDVRVAAIDAYLFNHGDSPDALARLENAEICNGGIVSLTPGGQKQAP